VNNRPHRNEAPGNGTMAHGLPPSPTGSGHNENGRPYCLPSPPLPPPQIHNRLPPAAPAATARRHGKIPAVTHHDDEPALTAILARTPYPPPNGCKAALTGYSDGALTGSDQRTSAVSRSDPKGHSLPTLPGLRTRGPHARLDPSQQGIAARPGPSDHSRAASAGTLPGST